MPRTARKAVEPMEEDIGQNQPRILKSAGPAKQALSSQHIELVDRPVDPEKLAMLAFMEEMVTVYIHPTTNEQDEQVFEIYNNGDKVLFRRNEEKTVKRKFVYGLAKSRTTNYTQQEVINAEGVRDYKYFPHTGLRYPFSPRQDDNPRGADWLRATLGEP